MIHFHQNKDHSVRDRVNALMAFLRDPFMGNCELFFHGNRNARAIQSLG